MRIHSDTLTRSDLFRAASKAQIRLFSLTDHGSRKRGHAFEVLASGSSPFRTMGNPEEYAATWDEWGIFLNALYEVDADMIAGQYKTREQFDAYTGYRFETLEKGDDHRRHTWEYNGYCSECECGATLDNSAFRAA